jgi:hypothetical protein
MLQEEKIPYLERWSSLHGGKSLSSQVTCLKSTAFMPLSLPSTKQPLPVKRTSIYTQMTFMPTAFVGHKQYINS